MSGAGSGATNRIDATFARVKAEGRIGLFPYLAAGYPDRQSCVRLLDVMARAGADGFELGIPFSDPLADGVTMQKASARALDQGITLAGAFEIVAEFRQLHPTVPVVMMSYVNPLLAYGFDRLCADAATIGVDGFIVPDMPLEEAATLAEAAKARGLHYVYFLAPTSNQERIDAVGAASSGFIYCVALVGTTGARAELSPELAPFLKRARAATDTPLVVGFGISTPAHVAGLVGQADGAIVSSAIANLIDETSDDEVDSAVARFVAELRAATSGATAAAR
ncbi:MAG: tryptophan synthase subunit alpha [Chloroflexota bacterium]